MDWENEELGSPHVFQRNHVTRSIAQPKRPLLAWILLPAFAVSIATFGAPLKWEQKEGYRVAPLEVPATGKTGFTLLTPEQTNIRFTNNLSYDRSQTNQNLLNGSGVAAGDYDGDGLCDLYFCSLEGANALFRNLGNGRFENVTASAGVACAHMSSRGAAFADVDGDGRLDLIVTSLSGPNACLLNRGNGRFEDVTTAAGLVLKAGSESLALADIDGDGALDLYVANNGEFSILRSGGTISVRNVNGRDIVTGRWASRIKLINGKLVEYGEPHALYINDGHGRFTRASWTDGRFRDAEGKPLKAAPADLGLSVMFRDINGDGFPDLYVCNDFQTPDRIWINDGKGNFRALPDLAIRSTSHFSMGIDFADIDRDGRDDFFVNDMLSRFHTLRMTQINASNPPPAQVGESMDRQQIRRNTLQWNRGDGTYADIANFAGVDASDWSWSVVFLDVDLDGYEDLLIANGHAYDTQDLDTFERSPNRDVSADAMQSKRELKDYPPLLTPNVLFRNRGDRTFEEVGAKWGFNSTNVSHGIALADIDNDGDLDVVVSCLWKAPLIYRNESSAPRVAVRLHGRAPNTQGIGSKIEVVGGAVPMQTQEIISGGRYLSGDDPMRVFAAGSFTNRLTINVTWRSGRRTKIAGALPNHIYEIDESGSTEPTKSAQPPLAAALFEDVSSLVAHKHEESAFNDGERQPLLFKSLSQAGPGISWVNSNEREALVVTAGRGGATSLFEPESTGKFRRMDGPKESDEQLCAVTWIGRDGKQTLLVSKSRYATGETNTPIVENLDFSKSGGAALQLSTSTLWSPGPLAVADIDGDGDLDLFVGGKVIPGRYPEPTASFIFRNDNGELVLDRENSQLLREAGLVNGAVFSDLDADGFPELVLACEWGPIRVFHNARGKFSEITSSLGLAELSGRWNGVTAGDFDGDGKMDLIASNWGLNSSCHQPSTKEPIGIYYGDLSGNGTFDLLEYYVDPFLGKSVPTRDLVAVSAAAPWLRERFPSHKSWANTDLPAIIAPHRNTAKSVRSTTLATMVFLNRGDHFEPVPLPDEAQFAPAFGVNAADFNGDGIEDIFLAQNFFDMRPEEPRLDAGRGLLLVGTGNGKFRPIPGQESGIKIYGQQKGSAVADFDGDGRVDLAVGQTAAETKLYHNVQGIPGVRVRLIGPPGNPAGVGAKLRIKIAATFRPAREIHAGSGYCSQDSVVQVLAKPREAAQLEIQWPGGKATTSDLPSDVKEVTVDTTGKLTKTR
jgi:enediyne biosynthesis protein E4